MARQFTYEKRKDILIKVSRWLESMIEMDAEHFGISARDIIVQRLVESYVKFPFATKTWGQRNKERLALSMEDRQIYDAQYGFSGDEPTEDNFEKK
jgi:hypothetical protein